MGKAKFKFWQTLKLRLTFQTHEFLKNALEACALQKTVHVLMLVSIKNCALNPLALVKLAFLYVFTGFETESKCYQRKGKTKYNILCGVEIFACKRQY